MIWVAYVSFVALVLVALHDLGYFAAPPTPEPGIDLTQARFRTQLQHADWEARMEIQ